MPSLLEAAEGVEQAEGGRKVEEGVKDRGREGRPELCEQKTKRKELGGRRPSTRYLTSREREGERG